jgi:DNA-binding transcriptional LysR family regulator
LTDSLSTIRLFAKIARTGSFSLAGRELGLSQSTVSRAIVALEKELGVALFTRTTRAVALTEAGTIYFGRIEAILDALDEAADLARGTGELRGVLRVGLPSSFAIRELIPRLSVFTRAHPALHVQLVLDHRMQDLISQRIDIALRFGALSDSTAVARRIGSWKCAIAASPGYLKLLGTPNLPFDLASHSAISVSTESQTMTFHRDGQMASIKMTGSLEVSTTEGAMAAAIAGLGIVYANLGALKEPLAEGDLVRLLPDWDMGELEGHAVFPAGRAAKPAARAFADFLIESHETTKDLEMPVGVERIVNCGSSESVHH